MSPKQSQFYIDISLKQSNVSTGCRVDGGIYMPLDVPETLENYLLSGLKLKPSYSSDFTSG